MTTPFSQLRERLQRKQQEARQVKTVDPRGWNFYCLECHVMWKNDWHCWVCGRVGTKGMYPAYQMLGRSGFTGHSVEFTEEERADADV